ncbi:MAG: hypothetical protein HY586_01745, partial [Candidatus Omnitrophica bacterium]|nr:hypothetical protein [Candidatus Omnitrophota bacterium]
YELKKNFKPGDNPDHESDSARHFDAAIQKKQIIFNEINTSPDPEVASRQSALKEALKSARETVHHEGSLLPGAARLEEELRRLWGSVGIEPVADTTSDFKKIEETLESINIKAWQAKVVREHSVILIDPGSYLQYKDRSKFDNYIRQRSKEFGEALHKARQDGDAGTKVFVLRGQIPFGWTQEVMNLVYLHSDNDSNFCVVYAPDLLRGGQHLKDIKYQRLILGFPDLEAVFRERMSEDQRRQALDHLKTAKAFAEQSLVRLLAHLPHGRKFENSYIAMSSASAEIVPFGTQLFLFTKLLMFMNFAQLVHAQGGDMKKVAIGAGLDPRIGLDFTEVAFGIGGDAREFLEFSTREFTGEDTETQLWLQWIGALKKANETMIQWFEQLIFRTFQSRFNMDNFGNAEFGILGLAFKADTGSLRGSPALDLIRSLIIQNVKSIHISDPHVSREEFMEVIRQMKEKETSHAAKLAFDRALDPAMDFFKFHSDPLEVIRNSNAVIIATNHKEFCEMDPEALAKATRKHEQDALSTPIFDGRNLFALGPMQSQKVNYISIGRRPVGPAFSSLPDRSEIENIEFSREIKVEMNAENRPVARTAHPLKVAVIGSGYVGFTTGAAIAELGHGVSMIEKDSDRVLQIMDELRRADKEPSIKAIRMPIHEPGLGKIILENHKADRIRFYVSPPEMARLTEDGNLAGNAIAEAEVIYLAVGTPQEKGGAPNLNHILGAAKEIGYVFKELVLKEGNQEKYPQHKVIVVKSTVPSYTFSRMREELKKAGLQEGVHFELASNPEFLQEGRAVENVFHPARTLLGVESKFAAKVLRELWYPLEKRYPHKVLISDIVSSPDSKYLANGFLAASISFINALARLVEKRGGSIEDVVRGMKTDKRISRQPYDLYAALMETDLRRKLKRRLRDSSPQLDLDPDHIPPGLTPYLRVSPFLAPGIGFGGSCFLKDVEAVIYEYQRLLERSFDIALVTLAVNAYLPEDVYRKIEIALADPVSGVRHQPLQGKKITMLGTAFKRDTDDVRETPSLPLLLQLLKSGAEITVMDPLLQADRKFKILLATHILSEHENDTGDFYAAIKKSTGKLSEDTAQKIIEKEYSSQLTFKENRGFDENQTPEQIRATLETIELAACGSDMLVIVNDWGIYTQLRPQQLYESMMASRSPSGESHFPIIYDVRNLLKDTDPFIKQGFVILKTGRKNVIKVEEIDQKTGISKFADTGDDASNAEGAISMIDPTAESLGNLVSVKENASLVRKTSTPAERIIFGGAGADTTGELAVNLGLESEENLRRILEPIALSLRGRAPKHVTLMYPDSGIRRLAEALLEALRVSPDVRRRFLRWHSAASGESSRKALERRLIGSTARFGEGRVILVDSARELASLETSGVRKIASDEIALEGSLRFVDVRHRVAAKVAAIDLALDLLASPVLELHPDKLSERDHILRMKYEFYSESMARWSETLQNEMQLLIAA